MSPDSLLLYLKRHTRAAIGGSNKEFLISIARDHGGYWGLVDDPV